MSISAPTDLANCNLWASRAAGIYNDAGTTLASDGDRIAQWNDQSGAANHLTQTTTANKFLYDATGGFGVNACADQWAAVNGADGFMTVPAGWSFNKQAATLAFVLDLNTNGRTQYLLDISSLSIVPMILNGTIQIYNGGFIDSAIYPRSNKSVLVMTFDASNIKVYYNSSASPYTTTALSSGTLNGATLVGSSRAYARFYDVISYTRAIGSTEVADLMSWAASARTITYPGASADHFLFHGDSITEGTGATRNKHWPNLLGLPDTAYQGCAALAGQTLATMLTSATTVIDGQKGSGNNAIFNQAATNDLVAGDSAATIYGRLQTYFQDRLAAGITRRVAFTLNCANGGAGGTVLHDLNQLIRGNGLTDWEYMIDLAADSLIGVDESTATHLNGSYWTDGAHMNDAGYQRFADLVVASGATSFAANSSPTKGRAIGSIGRKRVSYFRLCRV